MSTGLASQKRECWAVLVLTALGAGIRLWRFGRLGLDHFDEGIYALSGLWLAKPGGLSAIDPQVIPYAPGGFPALVGVSYACFGIGDLGAIAVPTFCGILTIPLAAWLARRTFGAGAGVAAAALAALSGSHVVLSRVALTDVPFLFFWILALGLGGRFLERPGPMRALPFGVAVGMAQNLKYNGLLAGGIVALVVLLDLITGPSERRRSATKALAWGIASAVLAGLIYWPWFSFVEHHGGYSRLLAHHRGYLGSPSAWLGHWRLQMAQATALSGGVFWCLAAWGLAWAGCAACLGVRTSPELQATRNRPARVILTGAIGGGVLLGVFPNITWWLGPALCFGLLRDSRPAARVTGMWWLVMAVLTPFYHPYARLWLPLEAAGWIVGSSVVVERWMRWTNSGRSTVPAPADESDLRASLRRDVLLAGCMLLSLAQHLATSPRARPLPHLLRPTDGLRAAVEHMTAELEPGASLSVLARPPVLFYLLAGGRVSVSVVAETRALWSPGCKVALLDAAAQPAGEGTAISVKPPPGWAVAEAVTVNLAPATALDLEPARAFGGRGSPSTSLTLYVRKPQ